MTARPLTMQRTIIDLSVPCRLPETEGGSLRQQRQHRLQGQCLFSDRNAAWIALRVISTNATDDADGTDGLFSCCAHRDHSCPCAAFPGKRDLDPNAPQESLRPP